MSSVRVMGVTGLLCGAVSGFAMAHSPPLGCVIAIVIVMPFVMASVETYLERNNPNRPNPRS